MRAVTLLDHGLGTGLVGLAAAFVVSVVLVPFGIRAAWRLGVVDRPTGDKIHRQPTPLMGGAAVAVAFLLAVVVWQLVAWRLHALRTPLWENPQLIGFLVGCGFAAALGVYDEVFTLSPRAHFAGQIAVVVVALLAQFPVIRTVSNPLIRSIYEQGHVGVQSDIIVPPILAYLFTIFWIVGMMNTVNFLDGLDGLAGGVSAIAALFLGLWAVVSVAVNHYPPTMNDQNVILPLILCGAILGFLVFNWAPARVFMGDSGAMFIGFALGALSIFGPVKLGTALLLLIVPIIDVAWAIVRRLLSRRSFATGDKHHIYHRLLELGMSRRSVVLAFYALCVGLGLIDLMLTKSQKLAADAVVAAIAAAGAVYLELRGRHAAALSRVVPVDYDMPSADH
jgi:UDP-N-acetylmuramyl pentapeptide phosphotransferase/UDP-N-acetylglucosamine-1-phosphate transferase